LRRCIWGGREGKINQSMAFGVPVVAASLAIEEWDSPLARKFLSLTLRKTLRAH
jgi:hypothetical protein